MKRGGAFAALLLLYVAAILVAVGVLAWLSLP